MPESYNDPSCRIIVAWQGNNYIKKLYLWKLLHPSMDCMSTETLTVKYTLKYGFSTIISFSIICRATCYAFALFIPKFLLYLESLLWKLLIPLVIEAYLMLKSIIKLILHKLLRIWSNSNIIWIRVSNFFASIYFTCSCMSNYEMQHQNFCHLYPSTILTTKISFLLGRCYRDKIAKERNIKKVKF